ncbi:hypothetical protein [Algibacter sp. 2305UL17-15]|uniref:hypothetical protein n=1 Tax=Algibacter sp. 2305UL17-15 TaxID=3231268 RepID=UPI0034596BB9
MKNENLHHIKSTGFKAPDNYFESFDEKILKKLNIESNLADIKATGFKIPDGYFETLEDRIIGKVSDKKETKVIPLSSKKTFIYVSSIAAAILLLFNLSIFDSKPSFGSLETETVENYIIDENISSYEIASLLTEEQMNEDLFIDYNLDHDNLEEYLLDNADIEVLMIE